MSGIYLHIPFCSKACHYCDFHFSTSLKQKDRLIESLLLEIRQRKEYLNGDRIETIYFGGGTPSTLPIQDIGKLLEVIRSEYFLDKNCEVTLEANPEDLNPKYLSKLREIGVHRLSIGVQSFRDSELKLMNRAHSAEIAKTAIVNARQVGFDDLNIDLIYGIPGLDQLGWKENLDTFFEFGLNHLSAYCLTYEDNTAFGRRLKKGQMSAVDEEEIVWQFEALIHACRENGYEHYEISNFCKPGRYSKHNTSYWKGAKYLGLGPSAHSFNGESRRWNIASNSTYIKSIEEGNLTYDQELLSVKDKFNEYILTSLRTMWGCDQDYLKRTFPTTLLEQFKLDLKPWLTSSDITANNGKLFLSEKGKLVADKIVSDLFAV